MNSPNKSATISVADFLFLPFFQTPLITNSRFVEKPSNIVYDNPPSVLVEMNAYDKLLAVSFYFNY